MEIAGLWDASRQLDGTWLHSYTMRTINADSHALMKSFHKPADEKHMVVILPEAAYGDWLTATPEHRGEFLLPYPADRLTASATVLTR